VGIDISDANSIKGVSIYVVQNLLVGGDGRVGQLLQSAQHKIALLEIAHGKLADHKGVSENLSKIEQVRQRPVR
jgi:hypothetical protein